MSKFLELDKIIRDAFAADDKVMLLRVADMLAVYADERTLGTVLSALEHKGVSA